MNCDDLSREWRRFELRFPAGPEKYELYALLDRLNLSRYGAGPYRDGAACPARVQAVGLWHGSFG